MTQVMHEYPSAWGWTWRVDDLSGYEPVLEEMQALDRMLYRPMSLANVDQIHKHALTSFLPGTHNDRLPNTTPTDLSV